MWTKSIRRTEALPARLSYKATKGHFCKRLQPKKFFRAHTHRHAELEFTNIKDSKTCMVNPLPCTCESYEADVFEMQVTLIAVPLRLLGFLNLKQQQKRDNTVL